MKHKQTLAMLLAAAMVLSMPLGAYAQGTSRRRKFHRFGAAVCGGYRSADYQ